MKKITIPTHQKKPISYRCFIFNNTAQIALWILLFSLNAPAQVNYTELTPNIYIGYSDSIKFDINSDNNTDLIIYGWSAYLGQSLRVFPKNQTQLAFINDSLSALSYGEMIDDSYIWADTNYVDFLVHYYPELYSTGSWADVDMGFLALRIKIQGEWHYAWLRIGRHKDGWPDHYNERLYALDFALESMPNQPIMAGSEIQAGATSITQTDIGDSFNGSDILVNFTKAIDESLFSEYRIFIAPENDPQALSLEYVNQLPEECYYSIPVNNDQCFFHEGSLPSNLKDINGESLAAITPYQLHILNVSSTANPDENILSQPSDVFLLQTEVKAMESIKAKDIANDNMASDIQIIFDAPNNNPYADHYRVFITPLESLEDFTVNIALSLPQNYYTIIEKDYPYPYEITINEGQLDIEGNPIENDQFYEAIALSVADSIFSVTSVLSDPSRKFILKTPNAFFAGKKTGTNVLSFSADNVLSNTVWWDGNIVNPGYSDYRDSYIDLNRDGEDDFRLVFSDIYTAGSRQVKYVVKGERDNKVLICSHPNHNNWIDVLDEGDMIDEGYEFTNATTILTWYARAEGAPDTYYGHMPLAFDGIEFHIGFQINDDDQVQYAWLRLMGRRFVEYGYQDLDSGTQNLSKTNNFNIYPNPTSSTIHIESADSLNGTNMRSVSIYNSLGKQVDEFNLSQASTSLNISHYSKGLYFFVIKDQGQILETQKVMVE